VSKQNKSDGEAAYGGYRAGFSVLVGRPNAGKSTLTNALVGKKVAITSAKPQTTRHTIRGIVHREDAQLILVDTPGLHRPRTLLGKRLNELVADTLAEVDAIGFCLPANEKIGPGDKFIAAQLAAVGNKPIIAIVTKADLVDRQALTEQLLAVAELGRTVVGGEGWKDIVPVSATDGFQVETVADVLISHMPPSPPLYPDGELTDEPEAVMVAELIRDRRWRVSATSCRTPWLSSSMKSCLVKAAPRTARSWTSALTCTSRGHRRRPSLSARAAPGSARSGPLPARGSRRCWAPVSTSTCTSRSPRTGSGTRSSSSSWASEPGF